MIGTISNITRFGIFVELADKRTGLLRWSAIPKNLPKFQIGDLIEVTILKQHENGHLDFKYHEKDFKSTYGAFLRVSSEKMETLQAKNKELL